MIRRTTFIAMAAILTPFLLAAEAQTEDSSRSTIATETAMPGGACVSGATVDTQQGQGFDEN